MATPIATRDARPARKVHALTMLDLLLKPALVTQAWEYYTTVQTKDQQYTPAGPAGGQGRRRFLNTKIMAEHRAKMKPFYFDPSRVQDLPGATRRPVPAAGQARGSVIGRRPA